VTGVHTLILGIEVEKSVRWKGSGGCPRFGRMRACLALEYAVRRTTPPPLTRPRRNSYHDFAMAFSLV
jgi:hypothetical protein